MASSTLPTVTSQTLLPSLLIINHLTTAHSFIIVIAHTMEWVTENRYSYQDIPGNTPPYDAILRWVYILCSEVSFLVNLLSFIGSYIYYGLVVHR